jgi:hypothetical protein
MSVEQSVEWDLPGETEVLGAQQIPHYLVWFRTRAAAVGGLRWTAWAMARPSCRVYPIISFGRSVRFNNVASGVFGLSRQMPIEMLLRSFCFSLNIVEISILEVVFEDICCVTRRYRNRGGRCNGVAVNRRRYFGCVSYYRSVVREGRLFTITSVHGPCHNSGS